MLLYLAWDGSGFWTVLRKEPAPPPRPDQLVRFRLLGRIDGIEEGVRAVEGLNAWLASRDLGRVRASVPSRRKVLPFRAHAS